MSRSCRIGASSLRDEVVHKQAMLGYSAGMACSFLRAAYRALFVFAGLTAPAYAWGPQGHRLVGAIAEAELSPHARAEVARLLRGEPEPTLAGVSNWADDLREHDPDLGRRSARWHYVNLAEDGCAYVATSHCPDGDCVIEAIRRQEALLADRRQPDAVRAQALKFLVHFVGDIHQPLHAGYAKDRGGNTHQVQVGGSGSNLHRVWDGDIVTAATRNEKRNLRRLRGMPAPAGLDDGAFAEWAEASCRIVRREGFYPPQGALAPTYLKRWRPVADAQLRLGADRLARLLNRALSPSEASRARTP